jgi:hypothetical protein
MKLPLPRGTTGTRAQGVDGAVFRTRDLRPFGIGGGRPHGTDPDLLAPARRVLPAPRRGILPIPESHRSGTPEEERRRSRSEGEEAPLPGTLIPMEGAVGPAEGEFGLREMNR